MSSESNIVIGVFDPSVDEIVPKDQAKTKLNNKDLHSRWYCDTCPRWVMDCKTTCVCDTFYDISVCAKCHFVKCYPDCRSDHKYIFDVEPVHDDQKCNGPVVVLKKGQNNVVFEILMDENYDFIMETVKFVALDKL